jgi:cellulose synthase/poly-beta-1,6-N-acetylglucosamine synthase-like glycosyltransferase
MTYFDDKDTMAVAPSIVVRDPKTLIQYAQAVEYDMGHYMKKMLAFNGAIHVTPGPFSIFRKEVFENLGPYRKAHNTEDQEIALRMQKHGYKIEHAPDAYVFTNSPNTIPKLYRQRVRWIYGFIKNAIDYKELIFRSKYGNIGLFTIPSGMISISATIIMLSFTFYQWAKYIEQKAVQINTTGLSFSFSTVSFDFFYFSTKMAVFISVLLYTLVIFSLINGRSMIPGRKKLSWDIFLFVIIYSVVAPVWLLKSVWNAIWSRESSWTGERNVS